MRHLRHLFLVTVSTSAMQSSGEVSRPESALPVYQPSSEAGESGSER